MSGKCFWGVKMNRLWTCFSYKAKKTTSSFKVKVLEVLCIRYFPLLLLFQAPLELLSTITVQETTHPASKNALCENLLFFVSAERGCEMVSEGGSNAWQSLCNIVEEVDQVASDALVEQTVKSISKQKTLSFWAT